MDNIRQGKNVSILADAVRTLRNRRNLTTTEFAKLLGVRQSSVSRWENDENIPNPKALASLFRQSQEPERDVFHRAIVLQWAAPHLDDSDFRRFLEGSETLGLDDIFVTPKNAGSLLEREVGAIILRGIADPVLVEMIRIWRQNGASEVAKSKFSEALSFLRVALAASADSQKRRKSG